MNIGFIGTGKISSVMVKALCAVDQQAIRIQLSPRNEQVSEALARKFENVTRLSSNLELLGKIGQPLIIEDEHQLHTFWTITGLITHFYDLMVELSCWPIENAVDKKFEV